jgi:predicted ATPase/DNA-binding XRE family transcriptional regulator
MDQADRVSFAILLKRHRAGTGLTQEELAERAGLSVRAISDLERGVKRYPYPYTVRRLAQALELDQEATERLESVARRPRVSHADLEERCTDRLDLPWQPTPFVGRRLEVEQVRSLLGREDMRLLTLTGPGGVGKTRLALQAAQKAADNFPHGVTFVPLAPLTDPAYVAAAIAAALGAKELSGQTTLHILTEYLAHKTMLLVMDNFEHLLPAADVLSRLLAFCPGLTVMVTSRALLHLAAEHEYSVAPLAVPRSDQLADIETLTAFDAVALFLQRAQAVKPALEVTPGNATAIMEICRRLDGLPLAIELAAARARFFSPQTLLARLDSGLQLLSGGPRDAPNRQQTIRNTIDWSHSLLTDDERVLFRRLAVFPGGCTVETAGALYGEDGDWWSAVSSLEAIADQSLLSVEDVDGEPRFRMLETIRDYALEQLEAAGETEQMQRRHAEVLLQLAEEAADEQPVPENHVWFVQMEREFDNLQAALAWGLRAEATGELALRLSVALAWFWRERGYWNLGREWLERALERCRSSGYIDASPRAQAQALASLGLVIYGQGDLVTARSYIEQGLAAWRSLGDSRGVASTLLTLGWITQLQGDHVRGQSAFEELYELARRDGDTQNEIRAICGLGNAEKLQGHLPAARMYFQEALGLVRRSGSASDVLTQLVNLEEIAWAQGDAANQRVFYEEARATAARVTEAAERLGIMQCMIWTSCRIGEYERAEGFALEASELVRSLAHRESRGGTIIGFGLSEVARCRGNWERAASLLEENLSILRQWRERAGLAAALHNLGHVLLVQNNVARATSLFMESLVLFRDLGFGWSVADCVMGLAGAAGLEGRPEQAALLYGAAEAAHQALDRSGTWVTPANALAWEWEMEAARSHTDEETWRSMWRTGQGLALDEALTRAGLLIAEEHLPQSRHHGRRAYQAQTTSSGSR